MDGPITIMVKHLHAANVPPESVLRAVADMENQLLGLELALPVAVSVPMAVNATPVASVDATSRMGCRMGVAAEIKRPMATMDAPKGDPRLFRAMIAKRTDLSPSTRMVAEAIIGHYNRKTKRCDPSIARIARVSGVHRATVCRALAVLTREGGLFACYRYAGQHMCNFYAPNWDLIGADIAADSSPKSVRSECDTPCDQSQNATQTLNQTYNYLHTELEIVGPETHTKRRRLVKPPDPRQPQMPLPITGGRAVGRSGAKPRQPSHKHVADTQARKRLMNDFAEKYSSMGGLTHRLQAAINGPKWVDAFTAERAQPGSGIAVLTGTDPP